MADLLDDRQYHCMGISGKNQRKELYTATAALTTKTSRSRAESARVGDRDLPSFVKMFNKRGIRYAT